jgi:hypothetical protein
MFSAASAKEAGTSLSREPAVLRKFSQTLLRLKVQIHAAK